MAQEQSGKERLAWGVLKEVERMLVKYRMDPSASLGPELARTEALLRECGHEIKTTEQEVLPDVTASQDFDSLVNELDVILGEYAGSSADAAVGEHLVDCLREGDINSLIRRPDYRSYVFEAVEERSASQVVLSFLAVLFYLTNLRDRLEEDGAIPLDSDDDDDDDDDDYDYDDDDDDDDDDALFDDSSDFELGDQLFPPEP